MRLLLFDLALVLAGVVISFIIAKGSAEPRTNFFRWFRWPLGFAVVAISLITWGRTGMDPLQLTYCQIYGNSFACQNVKLTVKRHENPLAPAPSDAATRSKPPQLTDESDYVASVAVSTLAFISGCFITMLGLSIYSGRKLDLVDTAGLIFLKIVTFFIYLLLFYEYIWSSLRRASYFTVYPNYAVSVIVWSLFGMLLSYWLADDDDKLKR